MPQVMKRNERLIDVRDIDPLHRHTIIFQLIEHLAPGCSLQLMADHPPRPLRFQVEARYGALMKWSYLEEGPDIWRVLISRGSRTNSADATTSNSG
jgi:uncharacterized protein (DUF2249 family)